jgi:hypothetical protein
MEVLNTVYYLNSGVMKNYEWHHEVEGGGVSESVAEAGAGGDYVGCAWGFVVVGSSEE